MLDKATVTDQFFQATDQHQLKEHHRVERGLARVAVQRLGLLGEEASIEQLAQSAVEIMAWHALGEPKVRDVFIGELLVALHTPKIPLT